MSRIANRNTYGRPDRRVLLKILQLLSSDAFVRAIGHMAEIYFFDLLLETNLQKKSGGLVRFHFYQCNVNTRPDGVKLELRPIGGHRMCRMTVYATEGTGRRTSENGYIKKMNDPKNSKQKPVSQ